MDLKKNLIEFGLSEKEASAYLALLELQIATVNEVAQKADLNRSSAYVILNTLQEKGVVTVVESLPIQSFTAMPPEKLLHTAEESVKNAEERLNKIKTSLPDLKGLYHGEPYKPKVRVHTGVEGLIAAMNETLNCSEKIFRSFTAGTAVLKIIPGYMLYWSAERLKRKISISGIYIDNLATRAIVNMSPKLGESVFVSKADYPSPVDVMIWDNKVGYLIVEGKNITTMVIESDEISLLTKNMFDSTFKYAKNIGKYLKT